MTEATDSKFMERLEKLKGLSWISDAPLFIDEALVQRFFDAIVRPAFEHQSITEESETAKTLNLMAEGRLESKGTIDKPAWIPEWLFPLKAELTVNMGMEAKGEISRSSSRLSQMKPIWNAERQLEELTRHYFQFHPRRLVVNFRPFDDEGCSPNWSIFDTSQDFFTDVPRAVAFFDFSAGTMIIPTAAEFEDGTISLLYRDLVKRLTSEEGGPMRRYPEDSNLDENALKHERKDYWKSYEKYYKSTEAMLVIEEASQRHNRIRWIDFRMPLGNQGQTLHLHVVPSGRADAGVFGYNFVRRAFKHGVRLVGTLKSEPDINVMAIYDK